MGYNKDRGDTLSVANSPFTTPEAPAAVETPWWRTPDAIALAKQVGSYALVAAIALYLLLGVLRPLLRNLSQPRAELLPPSAGAGPGGAPAPGALGYEQNLQLARELARQDPKVVASVVKNWVSAHER
jgi:flagellar M-ring protein FliF